MSPEQINIAIAKACGWLVFGMPAENGEPHGFPPAGFKPKTKCSVYQTNKLAYYLPDYCNDLNAMHEAEKTMDGRQRAIFEYVLLHQVLKRPEPFTFDRGDIIAVITATAAQRAEAFLRTLGLWEEKP